MRIERVVLRNYRQFQKIMVSFHKRPDTDLNYIIGTNGTGKTNLLNALNWCLYGDEPHLSKDSQRLPLLNLRVVERTDIGQEREVAVEVWAKTFQGKPITFCRKSKFRKQDEREITHLGNVFEVMYEDDRGNTIIVTDDAAGMWVERFVPKSIREFFFFDGERLDNYFKEATRQNIRHAVFQISQLDLLENRVERKLQDIIDEITREAGRMSPKIKEARAKLKQDQGSFKELETRVGECLKQIEIAKNMINDYNDKLIDVPDVEDLENKKSSLEFEFNNTRELLLKKENEKNKILLEYGTILMLWDAIKKANEIIIEKRQNQEIPPPINKSYIDELLQNDICSVCGRQLDDDSRKQVQKLLSEVEHSSESNNRFVQMEYPLSEYIKMVTEYEDKVSMITRDISIHNKRLTSIENDKNQIDKQMAGYDKELIRNWYQERAKYENLRDENQQLFGRLELMLKNARDELEKSQKDLDNEIKKDKKVKHLYKKISFCERALKVAGTTRDKMMQETRDRIEAETKKYFFKLVWKKETFSNIIISDDYGISLIHTMGYDCLGSVSAGERELLALSFTLALHHASGFDAPIFIDTPVARISDVNRENFAKVLCEVSTLKQTVLFFTPDEYSFAISRYLDGRASGRYQLKLSEDERVAILEEL